jgi:hypothetical protein
MSARVDLGLEVAVSSCLPVSREGPDEAGSVWAGSGLQRPEGMAMLYPFPEKQGWGKAPGQREHVDGVVQAPVLH